MATTTAIISGSINMPPMNISRGIQHQKHRVNIYYLLEVYFLRWYLPLVLAVGFAGGLFCIVFLFRSKLFPKNVLIWMVSICVGDLMILALDALRMFLKASVQYDVRDHSLIVCKLHNYFSQYFFFWSAYMQACMSLQRVYFVWNPLHARVVLHWRKSAQLWLVVTLLLTIPNMPFLLYWHIAPRNDDCEPVEKWYYYVTSVVDLVIGGIIPQFTMITCTCLIAAKICHFSLKCTSSSDRNPPREAPVETIRTYKKRMCCCNLLSRKDGLRVVPASLASPVTSPLHAGHQQQQHLLPRTKSCRLRCGSTSTGQRHGGADNATHVTRLLLSMNAFFMLTSFPLSIYLMHLNYGLENNVGVTISKEMHKFLYYLLRSLCYLNSSCNWIFYCFAGKLFRKRARRIFLQVFCPSRLEARLAGRAGMDGRTHGGTAIVNFHATTGLGATGSTAEGLTCDGRSRAHRCSPMTEESHHRALSIPMSDMSWPPSADVSHGPDHHLTTINVHSAH